MKYYIYVSATKVNMLFSQIPQSIKTRIAAEVKIDLQLLSTTFKDKDTVVEQELYRKLDIVTKYIKEHFDVGTVEEPKSYISDTLNIKWGEYPDSGLVYFTGIRNKSIVGLGGSLKHVSGYNQIQKLIPLPSSMPNSLLRALISELRVPLVQDVEDLLFPNETRIIRAIRHAQTALIGVEQRIEFLAKTLTKAESKQTKTVLGTPIYVAIAE